jgi:uncharacterized protein (DUF1697 family)
LTTFIALLRAVNVGGTGKLAMADLTNICEAAGFTYVHTLLASGNVVFESNGSEKKVKALLEMRLAAHVGKPVGVMVRTASEMAAVLAANPFSQAAPNRTVAIFLDRPPPEDALGAISGKSIEEIRLGKREIYVYYGAAMADSKLKIPAAKQGTARNMNTVAKLAAVATKARDM